MSPIALIVDPDSYFAPRLGDVAAHAGWGTVVETTFIGARREIAAKRPNAVITNLRLGMFNGIHLAYLVRMARPKSRAIVYADPADSALGVEAQRAAAFYESHDLVVHALPSYLGAQLPPNDRRNVLATDRRVVFRGGRRITDRHALRQHFAIV